MKDICFELLTEIKKLILTKLNFDKKNLKKSFEKIKKFKQPITIENILIKKPMYTLKKNPDERKKNKFPGKEKEL